MVERTTLTAAELDVYDGHQPPRDTSQTVADRVPRVHSHLGAAPRVVIANHDGTYATSGSPDRDRAQRDDRIARTPRPSSPAWSRTGSRIVEGHHAVVSLFGAPPDDTWLQLRRDAEAIADERAVALLVRAGYAPTAMGRALRLGADRRGRGAPTAARRADRRRVEEACRWPHGIRGPRRAVPPHQAHGGRPRLAARPAGQGRLGRRGARCIAIDLEDADLVHSSDDLLVMRRERSTVIAYAIGTPWAHELAATLEDREAAPRSLGLVTIGRVPKDTKTDDSPLGKAASTRSAAPCPSRRPGPAS